MGGAASLEESFEVFKAQARPSGSLLLLPVEPHAKLSASPEPWLPMYYKPLTRAEVMASLQSNRTLTKTTMLLRNKSVSQSKTIAQPLSELPQYITSETIQITSPKTSSICSSKATSQLQ